MILPKQTKDGEPLISYSQLKLWHEAKGFSTGLTGRKEYIRSYFLGETHPDKGGYGTFGKEVENYITTRQDADKFTPDERATLDKIEPLGVFQKEILIPFEGFSLIGFIDDMDPALTKIRDYKTASLKSKAKYYEDNYFQLDLYSMWVKRETGKLPKELEVVIIERLGNGFKGSREALSVGKEVWYVPREVNLKRLKTLEEWIVTTTKEISEYYKIFQKLNT